MKKLLFIINPVSGGLDKTTYSGQIRQICLQKEVAYRIVQTAGKEDEEKITEAIADFNPAAVIACGGDGTINLTGKLLVGKDMPLGIIPLGSANGLATVLNIRLNIEERINAFLQRQILEMDVLKINEEFFCFHLSSVGFNAKMIHKREKYERRGMRGYFISFFETLREINTKQYRIKTDQEFLRLKADMITFANGNKYGTGAIVNPQGKIDDGQFEVCIFKPYPLYALFSLGIKFFTGKLRESLYTEYLRTASAEVNCSRPTLLEVDGEVMGRFERIVVEILPEKLKVLV